MDEDELLPLVVQQHVSSSSLPSQDKQQQQQQQQQRQHHSQRQQGPVPRQQKQKQQQHSLLPPYLTNGEPHDEITRLANTIEIQTRNDSSASNSLESLNSPYRQQQQQQQQHLKQNHQTNSSNNTATAANDNKSTRSIDSSSPPSTSKRLKSLFTRNRNRNRTPSPSTATTSSSLSSISVSVSGPPSPESTSSKKSHSKMSAAARRKARQQQQQGRIRGGEIHYQQEQPSPFQDHEQPQLEPQQQQPQRRRNFTFMRKEISPSRRRRVSSTTLEKNRAHARKLAKIAASEKLHLDNDQYQQQQQQQQQQQHYHHQQQQLNEEYHDHDTFNAQFPTTPSSYSPSVNNDATFGGVGANGSGSLPTQNNSSSIQNNMNNHNSHNKPSLNFAAFETDSCISANTSVYDMDFIDHMPSFDDAASSTSFFSSASNFSSASSHIPPTYHQQQHQHHHQQRGKNKNKLEMYGAGGKRSMRNLQLQQQQHMFQDNYSVTSATSPPSNPSPLYHQNQSQHDTMNRSSSLSTASTSSSTISGAAARRLMRRGFSQQQLQQQQQQQQQQSHTSNNNNNISITTVMSEDEASQYSSFGTPPPGSKQQQQRKQDERPPLSPIPWDGGNSAKSSRKSMNNNTNTPPIHNGNTQSSNGNTHSSGRSNRRNRGGSSKKKKVYIETSGFTFDAFGLDANEIDNEVNAAMKELEDSNNMDLSLFVGNGEDCSTASSGGSSSAMAFKSKQTISNHHYQQQDGIKSSSSSPSTPNTPISQKRGMQQQQEKVRIPQSPSVNSDGGTSMEARNNLNDYDFKSVVKLSNGIIEKKSNHHQQQQQPVDTILNKGFLNDTVDHGSRTNEQSWRAEFDENVVNAEEVSDYQQQYQHQEQVTHLPQHEQLDVDDSMSSNESGKPQQFQTRKATKFKPMSESQKRAQEWASERTSPILVSPLLVPKAHTGKKKETVSHRRAKHWAEEAPRSPRGKGITAKMNNGSHNSYTKQQISPKVDSESKRHRNESGKELLHSPSIQEDYQEVSNEIRSPLKPVPKYPSHTVKVLPPVEPLLLRKTDSIDEDIRKVDYDSFKSSAPTVPLRKVNIPPRPSKVNQGNNVLLNVRLRQTPPPKSPYSTTHEVQYEDVDEYYPSEDEHVKYQDEVHASVKEQQNQAPKLCYREIRERELLEEEAKRQAIGQKASEGPDVATLIRRRIAANRQNITRVDSLDFIEEKNDECDISSLRNKLRPITKREPEVSFMSNGVRKANNVPIEALRDKLRPSIPRIPEATKTPDGHREQDLVRSDYSNCQKETIEMSSSATKVIYPQEESNAMLHSTIVDIPEEIVSPNREQKPNFNSISSLFAQRSKMVNNNQEEDTKEIMETKENFPDKNKKDVNPPMNSVSALFQARSEMIMKVTKVEEDDDENKFTLDDSPDSFMSGSSDSNLMAMLSKRSVGQEKEQKSDEKAMITVGDSGPKDANEKGTVNSALKDDPTYAKYFKMMKMGLPMGAVKNAMTRDGLDPDILDGDHNKPAVEESGVPLKNDPKYAKYFKMIKMGLPMGAVKNAMGRDGEDPSVMDNDHNLPASSSFTRKTSKVSAPPPQDKYRRTRLHWDTLRQVRATSVWAQINEDPDVDQIEIDENEFAELFQAERGANNAAKDNEPKKRNAVKVIDPKRANNGGIILARLKITYEEMAVAIDKIDETAMSLEQMQGIVEYIPNKDEKIALRKYMTSSNKDSADAFDELCECEKFMVAMMTVKHSKEKVRAILFKQQFGQCMNELGQDVRSVERSCDELRDSDSLRKLLGIVLNIGNRLNTAGPTRKGKVGAFTIESLLKLSQAKAFDKKTTFLHYIVMVVKRNNEALVNFKDDLQTVLRADKIYWDQCQNDLEDVENQLENVRKIALNEVYGKNRPSWAKQKKGKEDDDMSQESMTLEAEVESLRSTKIGLFTLDAIKRVSNLREHVERTKRKFVKLLEYFGEEDTKIKNPHQLFAIIGTFIRDFDGALEEVAKIEKQKRKSEKKQSNRTQSPSSKSRDSSRDEESSSRSGVTPTKPKVSTPQQRKSTPNRPMRVSAMQPNMTSPVVSVPKPKQSVSPQLPSVRQQQSPVVPEPKQPVSLQSLPVKEHPSQYPSHDMVEYTMTESEFPQDTEPEPYLHSSDDSISRGHSECSNSDDKVLMSKTVATSSESMSDTDSQPQVINIMPSEYSKERGHENMIASSHTLQSMRLGDNDQQRHFDNHPMDETESSDENRRQVSSPCRKSSNQQSLPDIPVPSSVNTQNKMKSSCERQAVRNRARAMRHQRVISQRSATTTVQQNSRNNGGEKDNTRISDHNHNSMQFHNTQQHCHSETIQHAKNSSNGVHVDNGESERPRRKPPSPEDERPRPGKNSATPRKNVTSALSISQEKIRSRRERMERRRRISS